MIVAIDGPAGAGKSSIARKAAESLHFDFLDTGALYRAVTLAAVREQVDWDDTDRLVELAGQCDIRFDRDRVLLCGADVTDEIRTPTVTAAIRHVADVPGVRRHLNSLQRSIAEGRNLVTEGRDQGTEVFPDADCKLFLTASPEQRALRRWQQLADAGRQMTIEEIRLAQDKRDAEDAARPMGGLRQADDAMVLQTDGMTPQQVLKEALRLICEKLPVEFETLDIPPVSASS